MATIASCAYYIIAHRLFLLPIEFATTTWFEFWFPIIYKWINDDQADQVLINWGRGRGREINR